MLSTGLLIGGPATAIAAADSGSGTPGTPGQTAGVPTSPTLPARGPIGSIVDALRTTAENAVQGVTGTLNTLARSGQQQSSGFVPPKVTFGGTPTVHGGTASGSSAAQSSPAEADLTASKSKTVTPTAIPATAAPTPIPATSAPTSGPATPALAPVSTPIPVASDIVVPVSNVIAAVADSVASTPALLVSLPTSATPVSDVLASLQALLGSVATASAPLTQLPADLSSLLGFGTALPGTTGGPLFNGFVPSAATPAPTPLEAAFVGAPLPTLPGFDAPPAPTPATGAIIAPATALDVKTSATSSAVASSALVPVPKGDDSSVLSIVQHVIGAFVATVSLTALAAMALPGIVALLGTCAAGIRIGYRQAKASSALHPHTRAMARFVGSGPIGVVRSGSQVSLRPRVVHSRPRNAVAASTAAPRALSAVQRLDRAS